MHFRKTRFNLLRDHLAELDEDKEEVEAKKKELEEQSLKVAQELAMLRERNHNMASRLEAEIEGVGKVANIAELPVVVGRNISKVRKRKRPGRCHVVLQVAEALCMEGKIVRKGEEVARD